MRRTLWWAARDFAVLAVAVAVGIVVAGAAPRLVR